MKQSAFRNGGRGEKDDGDRFSSALLPLCNDNGKRAPLRLKPGLSGADKRVAAWRARGAAVIDPTGGTDFSQPQKMGAPAHAVAEKVSEVKEPRKAERSPDSRLNSRNDRKNKHSGSKKKGFSLYV